MNKQDGYDAIFVIYIYIHVGMLETMTNVNYIQILIVDFISITIIELAHVSAMKMKLTRGKS